MKRLRNPNPISRRPRGMSLIELMIAMVLGMLLIAGIIQLFLGTRMTYMSGEALARVQENGRFALEFIKIPARAAGSRGFCGAELPIRVHLNQCTDQTINHLFEPWMAVTGWEFLGTGPQPENPIEIDSLEPSNDAQAWNSRNLAGANLPLPQALVGRVVPNTDVLIIRNMVTLDAVVEGNHNNTIINLISGEMPRRGVILITDCASSADIFQQSDQNADQQEIHKPNTGCNNPGPGNRPPGQSPWSTVYDSSAQVINIQVHAYYIGFNAERQEPGLYRLDISRGLRAEDLRPEELVSGVENMQLVFGYSLPGTSGGDGQSVDHWLTADQVPDWRLVTAVHVAMSVRSPEIAGPERVDHTFDLAGTDVEFQIDPQRLRQPFQATIGLRNRYIVE